MSQPHSNHTNNREGAPAAEARGVINMQKLGGIFSSFVDGLNHEGYVLSPDDIKQLEALMYSLHQRQQEPPIESTASVEYNGEDIDTRNGKEGVDDEPIEDVSYDPIFVNASDPDHYGGINLNYLNVIFGQQFDSTPSSEIVGIGESIESYTRSLQRLDRSVLSKYDLVGGQHYSLPDGIVPPSNEIERFGLIAAYANLGLLNTASELIDYFKIGREYADYLKKSLLPLFYAMHGWNVLEGKVELSESFAKWQERHYYEICAYIDMHKGGRDEHGAYNIGVAEHSLLFQRYTRKERERFNEERERFNSLNVEGKEAYADGLSEELADHLKAASFYGKISSMYARHIGEISEGQANPAFSNIFFTIDPAYDQVHVGQKKSQVSWYGGSRHIVPPAYEGVVKAMAPYNNYSSDSAKTLYYDLRVICPAALHSSAQQDYGLSDAALLVSYQSTHNLLEQIGNRIEGDGRGTPPSLMLMFFPPQIVRKIIMYSELIPDLALRIASKSSNRNLSDLLDPQYNGRNYVTEEMAAELRRTNRFVDGIHAIGEEQPYKRGETVIFDPARNQLRSRRPRENSPDWKVKLTMDNMANGTMFIRSKDI